MAPASRVEPQVALVDVRRLDGEALRSSAAQDVDAVETPDHARHRDLDPLGLSTEGRESSPFPGDAVRTQGATAP